MCLFQDILETSSPTQGSGGRRVMGPSSQMRLLILAKGKALLPAKHCKVGQGWQGFLQSTRFAHSPTSVLVTTSR